MRKNCFRLLSLTVLAVAVTSISAFAADASIDAKSSHDDVMISTIGTDTDKVNVTYSGAQAKKEYLIMVQSGDNEIPDVDNLVYIDQTTAEGDVVFTVLPKEMKNGTIYHVYLSSNANSGITTRQEVGTFEYKANSETTAGGDINNDGSTDITDALMILNHIVGNTTLTGDRFSAADIVKDGTVDINDALKLLNYIVGNIDTLS